MHDRDRQDHVLRRLDHVDQAADRLARFVRWVWTVDARGIRRGCITGRASRSHGIRCAMRTIGTWITRSGLDDPARTAADLRAAGLTFGSIMLSDLSAKRAEVDFVTHPEAQIVALADALHAAGLKVSLTTWVMPHEKFIRSMAATLRPLLEETDATGLVLDAEEPWIQATGRMSYDGAASLVGELLAGVDLTLSGIASANTMALSGLSRVCSTWSPQCYATTRPDSLPADKAVDIGVDKWRKKFGEPRSWMPGLASYSQPRPASRYMQPCLDRAESLGLDDVCYWSHRPIIKRADVRAVIKGIEHDMNENTGESIMPELDIEAAPSGVVDQSIAQVQGLLSAAVLRHGTSVDPGKIDGLPGPKTLAALNAFQAAECCAPTGVVDGQTWWLLLSC